MCNANCIAEKSALKVYEILYKLLVTSSEESGNIECNYVLLS